MPKANDCIGPYQLINRLGKGTFGEVWLAQLENSKDSPVALKLPNEPELDFGALLKEAIVWARAGQHPNVVEFLDADVFDQQAVIVSEYAPDGSLEQWLKRNGGRAPTVDVAVEMTRGILDGLEHLHSKRIIHRDIKPANILMHGATPRLADFGHSRVLASTMHSSIVAGTPAYMAPEAFDAVRNEQTDLWSVGVLLYQMLAGRMPFPQRDQSSLMKAILMAEAQPLPADLPDWLRQAVGTAMSKDPAERFRSATEMRGALVLLAARPIQQSAKFAEPIKPPDIPKPSPVIKPPYRSETVIEPTTIKRGKVFVDLSPKPEPSPAFQPPPQREPVLIESQPPKDKTTAPDPPFQPEPALSKPLQSRGRRSRPLTSNHNRPAQSLWKPAWLKRLLSAIRLRPVIKWAAGLAAIVIVLATYFAIKTLSTSLPDLGEAFVENLNGVKLEMIRVPAGSFMMGDGSGYFSNQSQHQVTVPSFYMGKYEVTQPQWRAVMGNNPSYFKSDDLPVEQVSWNDAKAFCEKLSQMTGRTYRLPSEAEWEYACRAKTTGDYAGDLNSMAWHQGNSGGKTHAVGQKQPNTFGIFDMHGNVLEWCEDSWHDDFNGAPTDGSAWLTWTWLCAGNSCHRVLRGGSWSQDGGARSADRQQNEPYTDSNDYGLRVVLSARTR